MYKTTKKYPKIANLWKKNTRKIQKPGTLKIRRVHVQYFKLSTWTPSIKNGDVQKNLEIMTELRPSCNYENEVTIQQHKT